MKRFPRSETIPEVNQSTLQQVIVEELFEDSALVREIGHVLSKIESMGPSVRVVMDMRKVSGATAHGAEGRAWETRDNELKSWIRLLE